MKKYEKAYCVVVLFPDDDVITASPNVEYPSKWLGNQETENGDLSI